jgi:NlpC/P60 family putative phage cell wall peptidase
MDSAIALRATRGAIVRETLSWIGTPYRHQASVKGVGCDCLGLVRGVWRAFYGPEPEAAPPYTPDWAEASGRETLFEAAQRHLIETDRAAAAPGDVLLFRMGPSTPMKHAAIIIGPARIAHAYWGRAVVESRLSPWWRARVAAAFAFPGVRPWRN